jgi:gliding motility-associated-like protein
LPHTERFRKNPASPSYFWLILPANFEKFQYQAMLYRLFPLTMMLLVAGAAVAQMPQNISLQSGSSQGGAENMLACIDQFAGTISFANFVGQSNDISLDTIFFCENDQMNIVHNGDANLTGDPNMLTLAGVTYGFFDCRPTVTGPNLTSNLTDPCIFDNPPPTNGIYVTIGGSANGNYLLQNTGGLQTTYNGGDPVLFWFAPLTVDNFALKLWENGPGGPPSGPCTHLNVAEAFAVVYLNEIQVNVTSTSSGVSGCQGQFTIEGGLPEWDGSQYDVRIELAGNPGIQGQIVSGSLTHGGTITFEVPVPGFYQITVEDGKSCGGSDVADMSSCVNVTQSVQSGTAAPGNTICLDVLNENGFVDIISIQYALNWDPAILQYTGVTNLTPLLPNFNPATNFNFTGTSLVFSWGALSGNGVTLPPGTVLYQVCFNVIGSDGDCTDVTFADPAQGSGIEVVNENQDLLGFNGVAGQVCVSNAALSVDLTAVGVTCPGGSNGSFTATVTGGTPPYQITWQNTAGGPIQGPGTINTNGGAYTANGLSSGTYNVTVTDGQGVPLIISDQVDVPSPPDISIDFMNTPPACVGNTGCVQAGVSVGGTPVPNPDFQFDFLWSTTAMQPLVCNLQPGIFSVTVTQTATGCTVIGATVLSAPPALVVNITVDSTTCSGIGDGSILVTVSGGTPDANGDYTIQWPTIGGGLTVTGTTSNIVGLESAYYLLRVTDANNCTFEQNVFLPTRKLLAVTALVTDIGCNNTCSGSIQVIGTTTSFNGQGPALPYTFSWFGTPPPPLPSATTQTSSTINNLCFGNYTVVMQDAAGCEIDTSFTLMEPDEIIASVVSVVDESCSPGDDGSITVAVTGGVYPYTYNWNNPSTDSTATGLSGGAYMLIVEDAVGCFDTLSAIVGTPDGPIITLLEDDTLACAGGTTGSLTVVATPGSAPITAYNWSNGDTGPAITALTAGEYIVSVVDLSNCTAVDTALVIELPPLTLDSATSTLPTCPGTPNGLISIFMSGGAMPYSYNWSNGFNGVGFSVQGGLMAGNYSVTILDANQCAPVVVPVTLEDPPAITVDFSAIDSVSCANVTTMCDGTATASAGYSNGGTGLFNFTWISGETDNSVASSTAVMLCQGLQQLTVSDGVCFKEFEVDIPSPPVITPGQDIENVSCNGLSDGSVTLMPSGGTPPYSINWLTGETGPTISNLPTGNYTALITDSKNCTFTHTVAVDEPDPLVVSLGNSMNVSCYGDANGFFSILAEGGNITQGGAVFLWENGVASQTSDIAINLPPGTYSVTVVDTKGCSDSLTHVITEPLPIQFRLGEIEPIACFGTNTFVTVDSVWGGNLATYQFNVDFGINRLPGELNPVFAGEHYIQVVDVVNNCSADTTITLNEPQQIAIELPEILEIELGDSLQRLDPVIISSFPIDSFLWTPGEQLSCTDCKNPLVNAIGSQLYTLTIRDINGCFASGQVLVDVDKNRNVYIPNIFSPNNDGINDKFRVFTGIGVVNINFIRVYDRWGELMHEVLNHPPAPDGTEGWDGSFRGEKMNPAVFLYLIEVEFLDGKVLLYRGDVSLIR